jgi:hypothetical protein
VKIVPTADERAQLCSIQAVGRGKFLECGDSAEGVEGDEAADRVANQDSVERVARNDIPQRNDAADMGILRKTRPRGGRYLGRVFQ